MKHLNVVEFDYVIMFWTIIGRSYMGKRTSAIQPEAIDDAFDALTGEPVRAIVKLNNIQSIESFKRVCHYKFKPIYTKLIMPIVRLSDLGYHNTGKQFARELDRLRSSKTVRHWYQLTQLCEAVLPMKFYEDASLKRNEAVMITNEEAEQLELRRQMEEANRAEERQGEEEEQEEEQKALELAQTRLVYEPNTNSMVGLEKLDSVLNNEGQNLVKRVQIHVDSAQRMINKSVKRILSNAFRLLKAKVASIFVSKPSYLQSMDSRQTKADEAAAAAKHDTDKVQLNDQVAEVWENMSDEELLKLDGSANRLNKAERGQVEGVGKRKIRRRKGDVDLIQEMRAQQLAYQHTKSWSTMFREWFSCFKVIEPSYMQLVIIGGIITIIVSLTVLIATVAMTLGG